MSTDWHVHCVDCNETHTFNDANGESTDDGRRWCAGCDRFHGPLYVCPKYSPEVRAKIEAQGAAYRDQLRDPAWVTEQRRRGVPDEAIQIMGMFAGVTPGSGKPS